MSQREGVRMNNLDQLYFSRVKTKKRYGNKDSEYYKLSYELTKDEIKKAFIDALKDTNKIIPYPPELNTLHKNEGYMNTNFFNNTPTDNLFYHAKLINSFL